MSKPNAPQDAPAPFTVSVEKTDLHSLLSVHAESGLNGEFLWPIAPWGLAQLYRACPEHGRAIHLKADAGFGGGLVGDTAAIDEICDTGTADLFTLLGLDVETFGNAFLQVIRRDRRPIGLRRLPAVTMTRYRDGFLQRTTNAQGGTKKVFFASDEVVHLRDLCPMGRRYAFPSWISAEGMLELAQAATRYNANFFKNNAMPEFAIVFKGRTPSADQKRDIAEFFRNEFQGLDNQHRTLFLSIGEDDTVEIKRLTAELKDADFLKLLDAARDRIPIAHGTPPRMLGIVSAGQLGGGNEVTGQLFTFEHTTLRPKRRRVLDQLRPLLRELGLVPGDPDKPLEDGQVLFRPLDLTPPRDEADNLPELVTTGILTPDEARAIHPALAGRAGSASDTPSEGSQTPITRSAPNDGLAALAALLTRL